MSQEEGDFWRKLKEDRQQKRWSNNDKSLELLIKNKIEFQVLNSEICHYRIGDFDFWATTGKFYNRKLKKYGRGIFNLIKLLTN